MSASTSWIMRRTSARVSARQPPRSRIRWSMSREAGFPVIGLASLAPGLAFAPAFGGDLAFVPAFAVFLVLAAGLAPPLARDARLAVGFALPGMCEQSTRCPLCCNEVGSIQQKSSRRAVGPLCPSACPSTYSRANHGLHGRNGLERPCLPTQQHAVDATRRVPEPC